MEQEQKMRFSKSDLELMRKTFGGNDLLLFEVRKHFQQFTTNPEIMAQLTPAVLELIRKVLVADPQPDAPIFQVSDQYMTLLKIQEMNPAVGVLHIEAKDLQYRYILERMAVLENIATEQSQINLMSLRYKTPYQDEMNRYVNMIAYLNILNYIEARFGELQNLSNVKVKTEAEQAKQIEMDSTK